MKLLFALPLSVLFWASLSGFSSPRATSPVVIELFTSEACSSCPPADAILLELSQNASRQTPQVIVLGEHVDYWNGSGWSDRFSSPAFTQRQNDYAGHFHLASPYTPQMVVDGRTQLVGNDRSEVYRSLTMAASEPKPAQIGLNWEADNRLQVLVQLPEPLQAEVLLAITEDGLSTSVQDGENRGRTLRHAGIVRELRVLGTIKNGGFETRVRVPRGGDWNPSNPKVVVFAQESNCGPILGAACVPYGRLDR